MVLCLQDQTTGLCGFYIDERVHTAALSKCNLKRAISSFMCLLSDESCCFYYRPFHIVELSACAKWCCCCSSQLINTDLILKESLRTWRSAQDLSYSFLNNVWEAWSHPWHGDLMRDNYICVVTLKPKWFYNLGRRRQSSNVPQTKNRLIKITCFLI